MNREILDAVKTIEREKGISAETLILALEDALLAAYKKTPEAAEYVKVVIDREDGEMRVLQLILDEDEEPRTLPQIEPDWGEDGPPEDYIAPAPEIDWEAYDDEELDEGDAVVGFGLCASSSRSRSKRSRSASSRRRCSSAARPC